MFFKNKPKMSTMLRNYTAFTLAEVLITLGIIGIVAEITIPTLMADSQKTVYVTTLKKAYSETNQVLIRLAADNGCVGSLTCTGIFQNGQRQAIGDIFSAYFKVLKNCGVTSSAGCWTNAQSDSYDGSSERYDKDVLSWYKFITADGVAIYFAPAECTSAAGQSSGVTGNLVKQCGYIFFDVNGPTKKPNNVGRDIFLFYISDGKGPMLYPLGGSDDPTEDYIGTCTSLNKAGARCAARIIDDGWQMNY